MPIVVAAMIGAGAGLYGAHKATSANKEAADQQVQANNEAARLQSESAAQTLAFEKEQAANSRADNIAAQNANYAQWGYRQNSIRPLQSTGLHANNTLAQLLGLPAQSTDLPNLPGPPTFSGQPNGAPAPQTNGAADYALGLVKGGTDPASAAKQTNEKFGLKTGSEAVYYPDSNTIGLPSVYLAGPTNKPDSPQGWNITPRAGNSASASAAPSPFPMMPPKPLGNGQSLGFVPGSLGSIAMG